MAETDGSGNITAYYIYGLGLISKVLPNNTPYYYHYDSRGSTIALTDSNQNQTDAYAYDSFGSVVNSTGSTLNPFKYVGGLGVMDEGNGLKYIRARYYSPELGRFITKDPLTGKDGDSQSLNRYVYAFNNPVRLVDVSGFSALEGNTFRDPWASSDEMHNDLIPTGKRRPSNASVGSAGGRVLGASTSSNPAGDNGLFSNIAKKLSLIPAVVNLFIIQPGCCECHANV